MKFITESELRDIYRIHPFTTYEVEPGTKLTPGARQFLSDRGIKSYDDFANNTVVKGHYYSESEDELKTAADVIRKELSEEVNKPARPPVITIQGEEPIEIGSVRVPREEAEAESEPEEVSEAVEYSQPADTAEETVALATPAAAEVFEPCDDKMLLLRFKAVKADFLLAGQELLSLNVLLDQSLMTLCEQITAISKALQNGTAIPQDLDPEKAGVTTVAELSAEKKDPFEVTSFHMQLPNGREILLLNKLRCSVQLLVEEVNEKAEEDRKEYLVVSARLNQIINTLSHLMSEEVGGK
jgi:ethanolamine utilization cobalamin adenosyltransferase